MKSNQVGSPNGRLVFYFHGVPGAPEECAIFDECGKLNDLTLIGLDRFSVDSSLDGGAYFEYLAARILEVAGSRNFDFIGFSIGAFAAMQTCRHLGNRVESLHLVSAAAPLDAGDFLDNMAGKPVFKLATSFPVLFLLLSYWQTVISFLFPKFLFHLLFASAVGDDKALANDAHFQSSLAGVLRACFLGNVRGYVRDVRLYVQPWASTLTEIRAKTYLWHGAMDNWSPPAMADCLQAKIPGCTSRQTFDGKSHYSCLYQSVPLICRQLRNNAP